MSRPTKLIVSAIAVAALVLIPSCDGGEPQRSMDAPAAGGDGTPQVPLTGLLPGEGETLPPGHPPIEDGGQAALPPVPSPEGSVGLTWTAPDGWVQETPSSSVRLAQYHVPGAGGDAEFVVFYFGPGQGGDPMANALRWAGQFQQPDGRPSSEALKTETRSMGNRSALMVEVTGTYANPMADPTPHPGSMLLGAVVEGPDANWFFKLTGPEATVASQRAAFESLIKSLR